VVKIIATNAMVALFRAASSYEFVLGSIMLSVEGTANLDSGKMDINAKK
jgi:hypothetical protein